MFTPGSAERSPIASRGCCACPRSSGARSRRGCARSWHETTSGGPHGAAGARDGARRVSSIAVVIPVEHARALARVLEALTRSEGVALAIAVVDNASADGSAELVERQLSGVRLVRNAATRVLRARATKGSRWRLRRTRCCSTPTRVAPKAIALLATSERNTEYAAAPKLVNADGRRSARACASRGCAALAFASRTLVPGQRGAATLLLPRFRPRARRRRRAAAGRVLARAASCAGTRGGSTSPCRSTSTTSISLRLAQQG